MRRVIKIDSAREALTCQEQIISFHRGRTCPRNSLKSVRIDSGCAFCRPVLAILVTYSSISPFEYFILVLSIFCIKAPAISLSVESASMRVETVAWFSLSFASYSPSTSGTVPLIRTSFSAVILFRA